MSTKKEHTVKKILSEKMEELKAIQNKRLDDIEKFVQGELAKINDRNKAVNGFVVGEVKYLMDSKLYNMELTTDALKALVVESNLIEDLENKLALKRAALHEQRQKSAEEQMKANTEQSAPSAVQEEVKQEQVQA